MRSRRAARQQGGVYLRRKVATSRPPSFLLPFSANCFSYSRSSAFRRSSRLRSFVGPTCREIKEYQETL